MFLRNLVFLQALKKVGVQRKNANIFQKKHIFYFLKEQTK